MLPYAITSPQHCCESPLLVVVTTLSPEMSALLFFGSRNIAGWVLDRVSSPNACPRQLRCSGCHAALITLLGLPVKLHALLVCVANARGGCRGNLDNLSESERRRGYLAESPRAAASRHLRINPVGRPLAPTTATSHWQSANSG